MFYVKNRKARKYFVGRRLKGKDGVNMFYSVPIKRTEHKRSLLTIVRHSGPTKIKIHLTGSEVIQLRRILAKGKSLMR
jgi:hypothetical protein